MLVQAVGNAARKTILLFAVLALTGCGSPEERAHGHYERGIKLLEEGDHVRAALEIRNALRLKEDMTSAWVALSRIEEHNQNWEAVSRILRRIISLDEKNVDARLRLSRLLFLNRINSEALKLADAATEIDPNSAAAHSLRAAILFRRGDTARAVEEAKASLALERNNVDALVVLAANRLSRGDSEGALAILDSGEVDHGKSIPIQLLKIKVYETRREFPQIEKVLQKLVENYPNESAFQRMLVSFYVQHNRPADAEKHLRAVADANPENTEAGLDVVRFLHATKGVDVAGKELSARVKGPGNVFPYQLAQAELYLARGHTQDAVQLLETIASSAKSPDDARTASVKLAEIELGRKRPAEVEAIVDKVLAQDRRNIGALRLRSIIQLDRGQYDAAIGNLREALNDAPRDPDLLILLAAAFERSGSMELADERLAYAMRVSDFDPKVSLQYVAFLRRRGDSKRADDVLQQLAGRSPDNQDVLLSLAQAKLARSDWAGAHEIADKVLRIGVNPGLASGILGEALAGQQKLDESIKILEAAYDAQPESVQLMVALAQAYLRAQRFDEAEAFLIQVAIDSDASAEARVMLGLVKVARGQLEEARKVLFETIRDHPKNPSAYRALASVFIGQDNRQEALNVVRAGLIEQPDDLPLRLSLAQILELSGAVEAAISEYEMLLQKNPGSLIVVNNLVGLLLDHRSDESSLEKAGALAARLRNSPVPQFKDTLGWLHYRRGEPKRAIALLEEAASELPNLPIVHYHLGLSYIAGGERDKGVERLTKALELLPNGGVSEEAVRDALEKASAM